MGLAFSPPRAARQPVRLAATLVISAIAVLASVAIAPDVAHAEGGLELTSNSRYQIQPDKGLVTVVVTTTYKNTVTNQPEGDAPKTTYFTGSYFPVPKGVTGIALTSDGKPLTFSVKPGAAGLGVQLIDFEFASKLYFGEQNTVELRYSLPGSDPRAENSSSRINPAYAGFEALAVGDPGRTTLEVELPKEFKLDRGSTLRNAEVTDTGSTRIYRLGGDALNADKGRADGLLWAWVSATNAKNLKETKVKVSNGEIRVLAWPGDKKWTNYAVSTVKKGLPRLERRFGSKWPGKGIAIRETATPYALGSGGSYGLSDDIELNENLDREVLLHELSYAWAASPPFSDRWLIEGLAQHVAADAAADLFDQKLKEPEPNQYKLPLRSWNERSKDPAVEAAGYNESWYTVDAIFASAGEKKIARVLAAATANADRKKPLLDFQVLLNVTEPATGTGVTTSTEVSTVLVEHVLGKAGTNQIKARNLQREARAALLAGAGEWGVPKAVDQSMNNWNFKRSDALMGWATDTIAARNDLVDKAKKADVTIKTDKMKRDYTKANSRRAFRQIDERAAAVSLSIDNVVKARAEIDSAGGFFYTIGSWFADAPGDHLQAAEKALAEGNTVTADAESKETISGIAAVPERGKRRVAIAGGIIAVLVIGSIVGIVLRRRSKRRHPNDAVAQQPPPPDAQGGQFAPTPVGAATTSTSGSGLPPDPAPPTAISPYPPGVRPDPPEDLPARPDWADDDVSDGHSAPADAASNGSSVRRDPPAWAGWGDDSDASDASDTSDGGSVGRFDAWDPSADGDADAGVRRDPPAWATWGDVSGMSDVSDVSDASDESDSGSVGRFDAWAPSAGGEAGTDSTDAGVRPDPPGWGEWSGDSGASFGGSVGSLDGWDPSGGAADSDGGARADGGRADAEVRPAPPGWAGWSGDSDVSEVPGDGSLDGWDSSGGASIAGASTDAEVRPDPPGWAGWSGDTPAGPGGGADAGVRPDPPGWAGWSGDATAGPGGADAGVRPDPPAWAESSDDEAVGADGADPRPDPPTWARQADDADPDVGLGYHNGRADVSAGSVDGANGADGGSIRDDSAPADSVGVQPQPPEMPDGSSGARVPSPWAADPNDTDTGRADDGAAES